MSGGQVTASGGKSTDTKLVQHADENAAENARVLSSELANID